MPYQTLWIRVITGVVQIENDMHTQKKINLTKMRMIRLICKAYWKKDIHYKSAISIKWKRKS